MLEKHTLIANKKYEDFRKRKRVLFTLEKNPYDYENYTDEFTTEELDLCFKIDNSVKHRKWRSKNDIVKWIFAIDKIPSYKDYKILFGTLTFSEETLQNTSKETRRRYVARFLGENTIHYKANIDFGEKNGREHYHFICFNRNKINMNKWVYGTQHQVVEIPLTKKDIESVKSYLLKLNNHSYKDSTRQDKLICDKNTNDHLEKYIDLVCPEEFARYKVLYSLFTE